MEFLINALAGWGFLQYAGVAATIAVALVTIAKVVTKFTKSERDDVIAEKVASSVLGFIAAFNKEQEEFAAKKAADDAAKGTSVEVEIE